MREKIASAILNCRGERRGAPFVTNVLELVSEQTRQFALEEADAVLEEIKDCLTPTPPADT